MKILFKEHYNEDMKFIENAYDYFGNEYIVLYGNGTFYLFNNDEYEFEQNSEPIVQGSYEKVKNQLQKILVNALESRF